MKKITELANKYFEKILEHWHWLHAHPELSGKEEKTAEYIAAALREMGLEPTERVGGYGVTAVIEGAKPGKCVGLRADIDALPVTELTGSPYASVNPGVCHACGHDSHAAMLLGAAYILNEMKDELCGSVKLIFQPAEEVTALSGARAMIADGVLENPRVDAVIGQHINPTVKTGNIAIKTGVQTAASDGFTIKIKGKGAHAARPHLGVDAIAIGAQVVTALQNIVARKVDPLDSAVVGIGVFRAGTAANVVADICYMEGTCRNLNPQVREEMPARMEAIVKGIAEGMGAEYEFDYSYGYSSVVNDDDMYYLLCDAASEVIGAENIEPIEHPSLGGEDFSFYGEKVPSVFYRLGGHKEGEQVWALHNGHFYPDAEALKVGASIMSASAVKFLNK